MTAKESSIEEKLGEITECCICAEVYDDPRVLPCIHTFCLKCIQLTGSERQPGEEMPCPICRTEFDIPTTGFGDLKKNFFMAKLVEMAKLQKTVMKETLCDVCRENTDEEPMGEIATATMYCTDCRDHLCDRCSRDHRRHKLSKDHNVVVFGSGTVQEEDIRRFRKSRCEQHMKEELRLYCMPCKTVLCMMCYVEGHSSHQCSDIEKVVDDFRKDIKENIDEIDTFLHQCLTEKQELEEYRTEVVTKIEQTQSAIILRGQNLKELIDRHTGQLLEELTLIKQNKLTEIEIKNEELEMQQAILDSFKTYGVEMNSKGSSSDICRVVNEFRGRTDVLRQVVAANKELQSQQKRLHIFFEPTNLEGFTKTCNVVGALQEEASQVNPILFKTIIAALTDDNRSAIGFAILDKNIFLVCSNSSEIEVYDSTSFIFQCQWTLMELDDPIDIASCNHNKCLYILDIKDKVELMEIMRVDSTGNLVNKWALGENWGVHIFITEDSNILLPANHRNRLNEYSPDGQRIRTIELSEDLSYPCHAIKLADDKFVVSFVNFFPDSHCDLSVTCCDSEAESERSDNDQKNQEDEEEQENEEEEVVENVKNGGIEEEQQEKEVDAEEENDVHWRSLFSSSEEESIGFLKRSSSEEEEKEDDEDKGKIDSNTDDKIEEKSNQSDDSEREESKKKLNEHLVCIVDGKGDVIKSFGRGKGSGINQLHRPIYLTIDREGQIIVADKGNSRVLLLSSDLEFRKELISRKQGFRHPRQVQLDESTGRLFVAIDPLNRNKRIRGNVLFFSA